jgi:RHS repeat-associated protein
MLVDSVTFDTVPVWNGTFELPWVNDYQIAPTGAGWSFSGTAGIAADGGTYTSGNPLAPDGQQVAFIRNSGSLSQTLSVQSGTYKLRLNAAQRGNGNESDQRVRVSLRSSASITSSKTFVWCGTQICEERDSSGANVRKRFFAEGEQRLITLGYGQPSYYYYTRDHLGSIRELVDANGVVQARYDYDPYGNRVVLSGQMLSDFGYDGYYYHSPSGLNLTMYRAYDPKLGRWLSRDPIAEGGGLNLYRYTGNNAINRTDPNGLQSPAVAPPPVAPPRVVPPTVVPPQSISWIIRLGVPAIPILALGVYIEWTHPELLDPFFDSFFLNERPDRTPNPPGWAPGERPIPHYPNTPVPQTDPWPNEIRECTYACCDDEYTFEVKGKCSDKAPCPDGTEGVLIDWVTVSR